jgi:hypothetical protein
MLIGPLLEHVKGIVMLIKRFFARLVILFVTLLIQVAHLLPSPSIYSFQSLILGEKHVFSLFTVWQECQLSASFTSPPPPGRADKTATEHVFV